MPTARDVAKIAGVAQSTVSYALSGKRAISEETRQKIDAAIAELGYHAHSGAKRLREQRAEVIALLVPDQAESELGAMMQFVNGISNAAREAGYDVVLVTANEGAAGLRRIVGTRACDGLIMMELALDDERISAALDADLPTVLIGYPEEEVALGCVDLDFCGVARLALGRFAERGHRRVVINAETVARADMGYMARFVRGCHESASALRLDLVFISPGDQHRFGRVIEERLLRGPDTATAFFSLPRSAAFLADLRCAGVLDNPDASVVLFDDFLEVPGALCRVELVLPQRARVSSMAVQMLVDAIEGGVPLTRKLVAARGSWG
ncbi:LacI family DNA-binding transcriptional regulator [Micrococcales bacterium 31B]|nr:LacI family DNA-binding transcriptional regulator [Micrococcales bacterium 31B]